MAFTGGWLPPSETSARSLGVLSAIADASFSADDQETLLPVVSRSRLSQTDFCGTRIKYDFEQTYRRLGKGSNAQRQGLFGRQTQRQTQQRQAGSSGERLSAENVRGAAFFSTGETTQRSVGTEDLVFTTAQGEPVRFALTKEARGGSTLPMVGNSGQG